MTTPDWKTLHTYFQNHQYLDAYKASESFWGLKTIPPDWEVRQIVFAGRLAQRLGGTLLSRALFATAFQKAPQHPAVKIYAQDAVGRPRSRLTCLREYEKAPLLEGANPREQLVWRAGQVFLLNSVRDFHSAAQILEILFSEYGPDSWLLLAKARLFFHQDKWDEANAVCMQIHKLQPMMYQNILLMQQLASQTGQLRSFLNLIRPLSDEMQAFETLNLLAYAAITQAERSDNQSKAELLEWAEVLCDRLPATTPLADRRCREDIALRRMDLGWAKEDANLVEQTAATLRSRWYQKLAVNLNRNPETPEKRVPHQSVWQGRNTCLPCSVCTLQPEVDLDALSSELTYGGTPLIPCMKWLEAKHGLKSVPFIVEEKLAKALFERDLGFIILTGGDNWSHAMAAVGMDEHEGTILIHDPSGSRLQRIFWEDLKRGEDAFGPQGFVIIPESRLEEVTALIPENNRVPYALLLDIQQSGTDSGLQNREKTLKNWESKEPDNPLILRARAIRQQHLHQVDASIQILENLLVRFPGNRHLRLDLLNAIHASHNTRRLIDLYATLSSQGKWGKHHLTAQRVNPVYLARHADMLSLAADGTDRALELLMLGLSRFPMESELWHILGDVLWKRGEREDALLPMRIASCLNETNEHYARAVADLEASLQQLDRGLDYLHRRTNTLGRAEGSGAAWVTECETLWYYGKRTAAVTRLEEALRALPEDPSLLNPAVRLWLSMGEPNKAKALLPAIEGQSQQLTRLLSLAEYARRTGEPEAEAKHLDQALQLSPGSYTVISSQTALLANTQGPTAALHFLRKKTNAFPGNEEIENLLYEWLEYYSYREEAENLLEKRLNERRDPWALRQRITMHLNRHALLQGEEKTADLQKIHDWSQQLQRVTHSGAETLLLKSRIAREEGDTPKQTELLQQILEMDADRNDALVDLCMLIDAQPLENRQPLLKSTLELLKNRASDSPALSDFLFSWASCFGTDSALKEIKCWREKQPNSRHLIHSELRIWVYNIRGVGAATQGLQLLEEIWDRYPWDADFIEMKIYALGQLDKPERLEKFCREVLSRYPLNQRARQQLATSLMHQGKIEKALHLLKEGMKKDPGNRETTRVLVSFLEDVAKIDEALDILSAACKKNPRDIGFARYRIDLLLKTSRRKDALVQAKNLYQEFPNSAYPAFILATVLEETLLAEDTSEIEKYYLEAIQLNPDLEDAYNRLALFLAYNGRITDAMTLTENYLESHPDSVELSGRKAWLLHRMEKPENAIQQLRETLVRFPHYEEGWKFLNSWLIKKQDLSLAREVFGEIPEELRHHLEWRILRLQTLGGCGDENTELEEEWQKLVEEHPTQLRLLIYYTDHCIDAQQYSKAGKLLDHYLELDPDAPYALARKVKVCTEIGAHANALNLCFIIWSLPGDEFTWSDRYSWEALKFPKMRWKLYRHLRRHLKSGKWIKPSVLQKALPKLPPSCRFFIKRQLLSHPSHTRFAHVVIDHLVDNDQNLRAWRVWKKYMPEAKKDPRLWSCGTRTVQVTFSGKARLKRLEILLSFRKELPGIEMWALTNVILGYAKEITYHRGSRHRGISKKKIPLIQRQVQLCEESLQRLQFDWTAQYLILELMQGQLALGNLQRFQELWISYEHILTQDPKAQGYWQSNETSEFREILSELTQHLNEHPPAIKKAGLLFVKSSQETYAPRALYRTILNHLSEGRSEFIPEFRMHSPHVPKEKKNRLISALFWMYLLIQVFFVIFSIFLSP